jgi:alpha-L-fucosidase 2
MAVSGLIALTAAQPMSAVESPVAASPKPPDELTLWYAQPAAKWLEALPIGNGSLGGMIFGGTTNERVQFNEQTLWLGSETEMGSYQPFGDVFVEWRHSGATNYQRELSLADATYRVSYRSGGVTYRREAFASYPDQVIVLRFTADQPGSYSGVIRLTDMHLAQVRATGNQLSAVGALTNGLAYESQVWVLPGGGQVRCGCCGLCPGLQLRRKRQHAQQGHFETAAGINRERLVLAAFECNLVVELYILRG